MALRRQGVEPHGLCEIHKDLAALEGGHQAFCTPSEDGIMVLLEGAIFNGGQLGFSPLSEAVLFLGESLGSRLLLHLILAQVHIIPLLQPHALPFVTSPKASSALVLLLLRVGSLAQGLTFLHQLQELRGRLEAAEKRGPLLARDHARWRDIWEHGVHTVEDLAGLEARQMLGVHVQEQDPRVPGHVRDLARAVEVEPLESPLKRAQLGEQNIGKGVDAGEVQVFDLLLKLHLLCQRLQLIVVQLGHRLVIPLSEGTHDLLSVHMPAVDPGMLQITRASLLVLHLHL
mmetsp:Transcript_117343/g.278652  ORF Transcript_117343/g.278652 Transcript_117343/m.278652 type:complete len:287 (+) Transcript_117343:183-1043(+)